MERNIHGAECSLGDITMGLNIREAKSIGRNALGTKCPWDEMSTGQNVQGHIIFMGGKMSTRQNIFWVEMSKGRNDMSTVCSESKMATGRNVDGENCPHNVNRSKCH